MEITFKGEVKKHVIKLPDWLHISDETKVKVRIEAELTKEEKRSIAKDLCGSWSNDPSIDTIFEEIEKERHSYLGRKVGINEPD